MVNGAENPMRFLRFSLEMNNSRWSTFNCGVNETFKENPSHSART
jgi:hypothetical protein